MSAIITHRFRKNNVINSLDEIILPKVMIAGCSSSGATVTPTSGVLPSNLQAGMLVSTASGIGTGALSTSAIVVTVSTNSFTVYPQPIVSLSGSLLSFFSQYYVGIGKADAYNGPIDGTDGAPGSPTPTRRTETEVRNNLIALQKVSAATSTGSSTIYGNAGFVLPRYNWTQSNYYKAWDSSDSSCFQPTTMANGQTAYPCFVTCTSGSTTRLYVCAVSGIDSIAPTTSSTPPSTNTSIMGTVGTASSDGYRWVYVSDLGLDTPSTLTTLGLISSVNTSSTLDSNRFFKVYRRGTTTGSSTLITSPTASAGSIYSCRLVYGGIGYTTASTFTIDGDGSVVAAGRVTSVNQAGGILTVAITASGTGYTTGTVRFTSGTGVGALIYPRIAPLRGFGYDVVTDLPAWYAGYYANFSYDTIYPGTADVPSTDQIRQISLIRNPVVFTSASTGSSITTRCLKYLIVNTSSTGIVAGDVIQITSGAESSASGYVNFVQATTSTTAIYYHQSSGTVGNTVGSYVPLAPIPITTASIGATYGYRSKSNYSTLTTQSTYTISSVSITPTGAYGSDEYQTGTGEVLFVQNRIPIIQAPGQSEAITIITQF